MFQVEAKAATWSHTTWGRGKRVVDVGVGCFMIEHIATGKYVIGVSQQVSRDVDTLIKSILEGRYANKTMVKLCTMDPDLRLLEFATANLRDARKLEKEIRATTEPQYLILN
jgi:hypothetical protein